VVGVGSGRATTGVSPVAASQELSMLAGSSDPTPATFSGIATADLAGGAFWDSLSASTPGLFNRFFFRV
jgi:hypothetical protein